MRKTDLWTGTILVVVAGIVLFWLLPSHTTPAQSELDLAPAFVPSLAVWTCLLLSVRLIWNGLSPEHYRSDHSDEEFGDEATGMGPLEIRNLAMWILVSVVTMVLLETVGFVVAGSTLLAVVMYYARLRNYLMLVSISLSVPLALYWIVWFGFTVELP